MTDIYHRFIIHAPTNKVFEGISSSEGLFLAMYLRILKRNIEFGEKVPFEERLNV